MIIWKRWLRPGLRLRTPSFFVADVLEKAHICKFNRKSRFVEPKDFEKIDGVKQVYEGKYLLMNENT